MSSWTDKTPQFNPYIQQLPVDMMLSVGQKKQEQYNQGIQKIQTTIDNVAGMDVLRDVDKSYLQSRLNQLGNDTKILAASDFSDFQLVNSVNGMTNQIGKDKYVQNAVLSTAKYRKDSAFAEQELKDGKSSAENQWDFKEKASHYLNSTNLDDNYNGGYSKYIDVNKKWQEVLKGLHSNLTAEDINTMKDIHGNYNYTDVMNRVEKEGISREKIKSAIESSFTPDDLNQMRITSRYTFRGATPEDLINKATNTYDSLEKDYTRKINELTAISNSSVSDPIEKDKIDKAILHYIEEKEKLPAKKAEAIKNSIDNPDAVKFAVYKEGALNNFTEAYAWENKKIQKLSNPALEELHKKEADRINKARLDLAIKSENFDEQYKTATLSLATRKQQIAEQGNKPVLGGGVSGAVSTKIDDTETAVNKQIVEGGEAMSNFIKKYAAAMYTSGQPVNSSTIKGLIEKYRTDPTAINANWRTALDSALAAYDNSQGIALSKEKMEQEVNKDPLISSTATKIQQGLSSLPTISFDDGKGNHFSATPKEIMAVVEKSKKGYNTKPSYMGRDEFGIKDPIGSTPVYELPFNNFTTKEKLIYNNILNYQHPYGSNDVSYRHALKNSLNKINELADLNSTIATKKKELLTNKLNESFSDFMPQVHAIIVGDKKGDLAENRLIGTLTSALSQYSGKTAKDNLVPDSMTPDELASLNTLLGDDKARKNLRYSRIDVGGKTSVLVKSGNSEFIVPLPESLVKEIPENVDQLSGPAKQVVLLQKRNNGSTNPTVNNPKYSYYKPYQLTNIKSNRVAIDFEAEQGGNEDKSYPKVHISVIDKNGKIIPKTFMLDNLPVNVEYIDAYKGITEARIWQELQPKLANDPELKEQIKKALNQ